MAKGNNIRASDESRLSQGLVSLVSSRSTHCSANLTWCSDRAESWGWGHPGVMVKYWIILSTTTTTSDMHGILWIQLSMWGLLDRSVYTVTYLMCDMTSLRIVVCRNKKKGRKNVLRGIKSIWGMIADSDSLWDDCLFWLLTQYRLIAIVFF
jgi:hypothetical protein